MVWYPGTNHLKCDKCGTFFNVSSYPYGDYCHKCSEEVHEEREEARRLIRNVKQKYGIKQED